MTGDDGADDILHVTTAGEWDEARRTGWVRPASLATEGFVHCSTRRQLAGTLARHFADAGPLIALVLDPGRLGVPLRWDEGRPGEAFPHVYGAIPLDAVVAVEPI